MATILPPLPRVVFTILEPISLVAGGIAPLVSPSYFVSSQLANQPSHPLDPTEHVLALQLGNLYLLLCLLGLGILHTTNEVKVVRSYIWALWIADIGHVGVTLWSMGWTHSLDISNWNAMTWGNIGATLFLFLTRSLYLLGLLGKDKDPLVHSKAAKQS